jgi:hypothetical protein
VVTGSKAWAVVLCQFTETVGRNAFGLNHSYDTALSSCTSSPIPGEYCDPYDRMGYENSGKTFQTSQFSNSAPGMTAPNLIKLGFVQPIVMDPHQAPRTSA